MKKAWIALLCLLCGSAVTTSLWAETRTINGVSLRGDFIQGGMVVGQVPDQAKVRYGGRQLTLTERGEFVLGFGRDEPLEHSLQVTLADGRQQTLAFSIEKREYNLQRVEGVPARTVNPDPSHLQRIQEEAGQVKQARDMESGLHGFLQQFTWPVQGPISGVYGSQRFYNGEPRRPHYGVDIAAPQGTEILAPADGVVTLAHKDMFFSGGTMVIDHGHGISTSYLHMSKLLVAPGTAVTQGQVIGLVGATGRATGPHLCWRLNWYQERLDPQLLIPES